MAKKSTTGGPSGIRHGGPHHGYAGDAEWNQNRNAKLAGAAPPRPVTFGPISTGTATDQGPKPGGRIQVGGTTPPTGSPPSTSFQARYNPGPAPAATPTPAAPTAPVAAARAPAATPRAHRPSTPRPTGPVTASTTTPGVSIQAMGGSRRMSAADMAGKLPGQRGATPDRVALASGAGTTKTNMVTAQTNARSAAAAQAAERVAAPYGRNRAGNPRGIDPNGGMQRTQANMNRIGVTSDARAADSIRRTEGTNARTRFAGIGARDTGMRGASVLDVSSDHRQAGSGALRGHADDLANPVRSAVRFATIPAAAAVATMGAIGAAPVIAAAPGALAGGGGAALATGARAALSRAATAAPSVLRTAAGGVSTAAARVAGDGAKQGLGRRVAGGVARIVAPDVAGTVVQTATGSQTAGDAARLGTAALVTGTGTGSPGARNAMRRVAATVGGGLAGRTVGRAVGARIDEARGGGSTTFEDNLGRLGLLAGSGAGGAVEGRRQTAAAARAASGAVAPTPAPAGRTTQAGGTAAPAPSRPAPPPVSDDVPTSRPRVSGVTAAPQAPRVSLDVGTAPTRRGAVTGNNTLPPSGGPPPLPVPSTGPTGVTPSQRAANRAGNAERSRAENARYEAQSAPNPPAEPRVEVASSRETPVPPAPRAASRPRVGGTRPAAVATGTAADFVPPEGALRAAARRPTAPSSGDGTPARREGGTPRVRVTPPAEPAPATVAEQIRARVAPARRRGGSDYTPAFDGVRDEEGFAGPSGINHGAFSSAEGGGLVRVEPKYTPIKSNHGLGQSNTKF